MTNAELERIWDQLRKSASMVNIVAENGAKIEHCQFLGDDGTVEIVRVWRKTTDVANTGKEVAHGRN